MSGKVNHIAYICSYCGARQVRSATSGRPSPGTCARKGKTRDGRSKPHSWVIDKKF